MTAVRLTATHSGCRRHSIDLARLQLRSATPPLTPKMGWRSPAGMRLTRGRLQTLGSGLPSPLLTCSRRGDEAASIAATMASPAAVHRALLALLLAGYITPRAGSRSVIAAQPVCARQLADSGRHAAELGAGHSAHARWLSVDRYAGRAGALRRRTVRGVRRWQRTGDPYKGIFPRCAWTTTADYGSAHEMAWP